MNKNSINKRKKKNLELMIFIRTRHLNVVIVTLLVVREISNNFYYNVDLDIIIQVTINSVVFAMEPVTCYPHVMIATQL